MYLLTVILAATLWYLQWRLPSVSIDFSCPLLLSLFIVAVTDHHYFVAVHLTATIDVFSGSLGFCHNRTTTVAISVCNCRSLLSFFFVAFYNSGFCPPLFCGGFVDCHYRDIQWQVVFQLQLGIFNGDPLVADVLTVTIAWICCSERFGILRRLYGKMVYRCFQNLKLGILVQFVSCAKTILGDYVIEMERQLGPVWFPSRNIGDLQGYCSIYPEEAIQL